MKNTADKLKMDKTIKNMYFAMSNDLYYTLIHANYDYIDDFAKQYSVVEELSYQKLEYSWKK